MNEGFVAVAVLVGLGAILLLLVLMLPITGSIFGLPVTLPAIGWIALAGFVVLAFMAMIKK